MYAVVSTGGKQHRVAAGEEIVIEKLSAQPGESVSFDVIFIADGEDITIEAEKLADATVTGEVLEHFKGEKAVIFKFKKRKGYKRLKGHRQDLTRVRITDVATGESKKAAPKKSTKKAEKPAEPVAEASETAPASETAENE